VENIQPVGTGSSTFRIHYLDPLLKSLGLLFCQELEMLTGMLCELFDLPQKEPLSHSNQDVRIKAPTRAL